jgi:hypothetical protein
MSVLRNSYAQARGLEQDMQEQKQAENALQMLRVIREILDGG